MLVNFTVSSHYTAVPMVHYLSV